MRLALAACAVLGMALSVMFAVQLSPGLATPFAPLFAVLILVFTGLTLLFGGAILGGLVWIIGANLMLRRGDLTRLRVLRNAEFYLALVLTAALVVWHVYGDPSIWSVLLVFFVAAQWTAWYMLRLWERPKEWIPTAS